MLRMCVCAFSLHRESPDWSWGDKPLLFKGGYVTDLKKCSMLVSEYVTHFTQLSCYAPDKMDTDEKKQDWFLNGLNDGLGYALEVCDFLNFQAMVDKALVLENRRGIMERNRKMQHTGSQGSNTRFHVSSSSQGPIFRPGQQSGQQRMQATGQGFQTPQWQI
jgi:hypothetical protein